MHLRSVTITLIVLALREKRMRGVFQSLMHVDTQDMLANSLTKHVSVDPLLRKVLSSGLLALLHRIVVRVSEPGDYDEDWLLSTTAC